MSPTVESKGAIRRRTAIVFATLLVALAIFLVVLHRSSTTTNASAIRISTATDANAIPRADSALSSPEATESTRLRMNAAGSEPTSADTTDASYELVIRTRNVWEGMLPDVELFVTQRGNRERLGTSDERGELRARVARDEPITIDGSAIGYRSSSVTIQSPCDRPVELALIGEGRISGAVELANGAPAGGAHVFSWPAETRPTPDAIHARRATDHQLHIVDAESNGSFDLTGLDPRVPYTIVAGADGLAPRTWILSARAGDTNQRIVLWQIYGLSVRVTSTDGDPIHSHSELSRSVQMGSLEEVETIPVLPRSLDLQLAGVAPKTTYESTASSFDIGVKAPLSWPDLGPIPVSLAVPGYEPAQWELRLPQLHASLTEQALLLRPTASGWGSLEVELIGSVVSNALTDGNNPYAWLVLARDDSDESLSSNAVGAPLRVPISSLRSDQSFGALPYGDYHVYLEVGRFYRAPPQGSDVHVQIGPAAAHVTLDLSDAGNVRFTLDAANSVDRGPITLYLVSATRHVRQPFTFSHSPYHIRAVSPGRYQLQVQRLPIGVWPVVSTEEFDVRSGETADVRLTWPIDTKSSDDERR